MNQLFNLNKRAVWLMKSLLLAYVITGVLLMILALLLFKCQLNEQVVSIGVIVIYIVTTLIGGFYIGKKIKTKKYLWGLILGASYFALLLLVSLAVNQDISDGANSLVTTLLMCVCGGAFGGMMA